MVLRREHDERGVTLVVCSGDEGTAEDTTAHTIDPSFPASSPHVLAVGGVKTTDTQLSAPLTWDRSGGGFSGTGAGSRRVGDGHGGGWPPLRAEATLHERSGSASPSDSGRGGRERRR